MPTDFVTNILAQLPVVAVFVWYSYSMNKQFQQFLREEREARIRQEDKFLDRLLTIEKDFVSHDNRMMDGMTRMEERTASREPTKQRPRTT